MTFNGWLQIAFFFLIVLALTKPMGLFIAAVMEGRRTFLTPLFRPIERLIYKVCGVREDQEQHWTHYAAALLLFSAASGLLLYYIQRLQGLLPFNPQHFGTPTAPQGSTPLTPDLSFSNAASFVTNTNWQNYSPESTMSYLVQMLGLTMHNF